MTLTEIRPTTARRIVRLVWFSSQDSRTCRNNESVLRRLKVDTVEIATTKVDPRDHPATIVERDIIVLPTTVIEVDGVEVLRFAGTPCPAKVSDYVRRSLAVA